MQIKVAKIEEEKKQLQYNIRAQDENLDKMKNAIKQSEESKKAITKENQRLLKDLKDSHTHKV